MEQEYPTKKVESNILFGEFKETMNDPQTEFVGYLTDWAETIRKTFDDGGANETMSTRRLLHIAKAYALTRTFGQEAVRRIATGVKVSASSKIGEFSYDEVVKRWEELNAK